jgi:hypothetical protein
VFCCSHYCVSDLDRDQYPVKGKKALKKVKSSFIQNKENKRDIKETISVGKELYLNY